LAAWAVARARALRPPTLPRGPGGRPALYRDDTVLLLALVQTAWRLSYKVHTVLCRQVALPLLVVVTPAHVHDSLIGVVAVLLAATLFGLTVAIVYADAAYFDQRFRAWVSRWLHARTAVDYNPRRKGKRQLASRTFMRYWRHCVLGPRAVIERHFAWVKRYFGLKAFQCTTYVRVYQFVLLTYCCVLGVALAAYRYQRLDLIHQRSAVLAVKTP